MAEETVVAEENVGQRLARARAEAKARREAKEAERADADAELAAAPPPTYRAEVSPKLVLARQVTGLEADAAILATQSGEDFDPEGVYVVMTSCIPMPKGPRHELQQPAYHGDYIAAHKREGVFGLSAVELKGPADSNIVCQDETDGTERLQGLFRKGYVLPISHPQAREARRLRLAADSIIGGNPSARIADPRFAAQKGNAD